MGIVNQRHEILFLYDVSWANPNGDPFEENKPRIDEETQLNIVTDVRLKRTVRDQLKAMGYDIFLQEQKKEDGTLQTKEERFESYASSPEKVLAQCIDIRLFGGTFALKGKTEAAREAFALTGPVQFKFGHSLHRVKCEYIKGTSVMPSGEERTRGTFTEVYVVPYSLIVFYGIVNEQAAQTTRLTEEDVEAMLKALWVGHKACSDVITRSKLGHEPRLLLDVVYKPQTLTHMGELDKLVRFESEKADEELRDISDGMIRLEALAEKFQQYKHKIEIVRYKLGERVKLKPALPEIFGALLEPFPWSDSV